jgi:hypothetical protein
MTCDDFLAPTGSARLRFDIFALDGRLKKCLTRSATLTRGRDGSQMVPSIRALLCTVSLSTGGREQERLDPPSAQQRL